MKRVVCAFSLVLVLARCDGFVGEVSIPESDPAAPIAVADPDYLVLRPLGATTEHGSVAATVYEQTVYYKPAERIMDLRHFDPGTALVEETGPGAYAVSIRTTGEGDRLLGDWTAANLEQQLGVFVAGELLGAPFIKSKITGMIVIDDLEKTQAEAIAARLRRGGAAAG